MKRSVILSFILICISIIIGLVLNDWMKTVYVSGLMGIIFFCIAGLLNGAFASGDRIRANTSIESTADRIQKSKITSFMVAVGLFNSIVAGIVFFTINKGQF
jgi:hypothetical protein